MRLTLRKSSYDPRRLSVELTGHEAEHYGSAGVRDALTASFQEGDVVELILVERDGKPVTKGFELGSKEDLEKSGGYV